ncbi:MAG: LacI family DNA-binding transcriptional regulator [Candidatus Hydrogenedentes bacterium]|nr:LacI family DNA-binding transcriptional regulator [Candidatus Hydrogenedentota bacterium]
MTAQDIAKLSGVSRTTVFAVVKGKPGVSPHTRERVWTTIREHGYENGLVQKSLLGEASKMIGVVVGDLNNPFYTEVISGIHSVLRPDGYQHMLYHGTDECPEEGTEAFGSLKAYGLRGYIISAGEAEQYEKHIRWVQQSKRPLVTIMEAPGLDTHTVRFDNRKGSRDATDYLLNVGHRRIACLTGPVRSATAKERILGFVESLIAHEVEFRESMTVRAGDTSSDGYRAALEVLSESDSRPTALLCCNDRVAIGAYKAAHELGLHIPRDVSIVGFDGIEMGEVMGPPLTTLSVFPREIGREAAKMLLHLLAGGNGRSGTRELVIEHKLIERESVRDLRSDSSQRRSQ